MTGSRLTACGVVLTVLVFSAACSNPEKEKAEHVKKGDEYVADKKDDFAAVEYASALKIDPKLGEAHWKLAQTNERLGNVAAAFQGYVRAADALPDDREAQIKATEFLILTRRFEDAKTRMAAVLTKSPKDVDGLILHATALAALNDTTTAITNLEEAIDADPKNGRAFATLGAIRMQLGEVQAAEVAFRHAVELDPSSGIRLALANFLFSAGRIADAEATLKDTLSTEPKNLSANRLLADLYMKTGRGREAEGPLTVISQVSKAPSEKFGLVDYYVATGRLDDARTALLALSKDPAVGTDAERQLAAMEYRAGQKDAAVKRLDAVLAKQPRYAAALALKAEWLTAANQLDDALQTARSAVEAEPQSSVAHFTLGFVQERRGASADAVKSYNEVLRLSPRDATARVALSRITLGSGQPEVALRYAEEASRLAPGSQLAQTALIRALLAKGDVARADTLSGDLLRRAPDNAVAHALRGLVLIGRRSGPEARIELQRALELSPGQPEALAGLTSLDLQAKAPSQAIDRLERALARQPNDRNLVMLTARAYDSAGNAAKAEQLLRTAVAADPGFSAGYAMLAGMYRQQNRLDEARVEYEAIAKREPAAVEARTMVGILFEMQGKRDDARKWYEQIVGGTQSSPVAANNLAFMYAEHGGNLDIALQLATSAKPQMPNDPQIDDTIGWIYYKKGLMSLAKEPLEASARRLPDNAGVLYHLGMTYAALGDKGQARSTLTRALALDPRIGGDDLRKALAEVSR